MDDIEIFTGYYANCRKYIAGGCALIGISIGTPKYLQGNTNITFQRSLAPSYALLQIQDEAEYTRLFKQTILANRIYENELAKIRATAKAQGKSKAVLMCYEKPPKFCHRSLVAEWLNTRGELYVKEYGYEGEAEKPAPKKAVVEQGDLFADAGIEVKRTDKEGAGWTDWR